MGHRWRRRHTLLFLLTATYFATRVQPVVIGPLVPDITAALDTSEAAIGIAITGLWLAYSVVQLPSGMLADRVGYRSVVVGALALGGVASLLMAASPSVIVFVVMAVLLGGGVGLYYNVGVMALSDRFTDTGWAIGIHRIGAQVAGLATPLLAVAIGSVYGWRVALLLGAGTMLPLAGSMALVMDSAVDPTDNETPPRLLDRRLVTGFFRRRQLVYVTILGGIGEFVAVANMAFLPAFLVSYHGIDQAVAGVLFSGYFLVVSGTHPVAGWLADRYHPEPVVVGAMAIGAIAHALLVAVGTTILSAVFAVALGLSMGYNIPLQSELLDSLEAGETGTWFGLFRTTYLVIGSLGGAVVGTVATRTGWAAAYGLLAALLAAGALLIGTHRVQFGRLDRGGFSPGD